jgi:hypothetical protein
MTFTYASVMSCPVCAASKQEESTMKIILTRKADNCPSPQYAGIPAKQYPMRIIRKNRD